MEEEACATEERRPLKAGHPSVAAMEAFVKAQETPAAAPLAEEEELRTSDDRVPPFEAAAGKVTAPADSPPPAQQQPPAAVEAVPLRRGVELSNSEDVGATIIRVVAQDRSGLLLDLAEHLKAQQLSIVEASVRTEGGLALDTFRVKDVGSGGKISDARMAMLKESLERLCGPNGWPESKEGWELNQHLGDTAMLRAHIMVREQWEIDRDSLEVRDNVCLGRGSFGEVHLGMWRGTVVAVKRLREDMVSERELLEFRRELAIVNHLAHPHIVQFLGAITNSLPLCIVTEYMKGGNLADLLLERGENRPFPIGRCVNWMLDTAKGMRYLHERRPTMIIHRDLKPENLLLDDAARIKITDFGLSKSAMQLRGEKRRASEEQLVSKTTCGTWLYTAPEVHNREPYSQKVDQFAFAMILYELLQGAAPFHTFSAEEATVQLALGHRPDFREGLNGELCSLSKRCWSHEPYDRPSFAEIQAVLQATLEQLVQPRDFEDAPVASEVGVGPGSKGGPEAGCCVIS